MFGSRDEKRTAVPFSVDTPYADIRWPRDILSPANITNLWRVLERISPDGTTEIEKQWLAASLVCAFQGELTRKRELVASFLGKQGRLSPAKRRKP